MNPRASLPAWHHHDDPGGAAVLLVALVFSCAALAVAVVALVKVRALGRLAEEAVVAARQAATDDVDWQLQWIEPGVYVLANTSPQVVAYDVEVTSALTPAAGGPATSATVREPRVNPGAWVEVRHPGIGRAVYDDLQQLRISTARTEQIRRRAGAPDSLDLAELAAVGDAIEVLQERVEFTLAYEVRWRSTGTARHKSPLKQRLVPSPSA